MKTQVIDRPPSYKEQLAVPGCPLGLKSLVGYDEVFIKKKAELMEAITKTETKNKFSILNNQGQEFLCAYEKSGLCMRICCGSSRGFKLHIGTPDGESVIQVTRPLKACAGCCWCADAVSCCSHEVTVESPPGYVVGKVRQTKSFWKSKFDIIDNGGMKLLKVEGPRCLFPGATCFCTSGCFEIKTAMHGDVIGTVEKNFKSVAKELFTDADHFHVKFPRDLDVKMKTCVIALTFLIDILYFDR